MRVIWWGFNQATQFGKFTIGVCVVLALRAALCEGIPKENRIHTFRPHPNQVWLNIEYLHSSTSQGVLGPIGVSSPAEYSCHTPSPVQCHTVSTVSKVFTQYSCHTLSPIQCHNTPPPSPTTSAPNHFLWKAAGLTRGEITDNHYPHPGRRRQYIAGCHPIPTQGSPKRFLSLAARRIFTKKISGKIFRGV